jgi:hypothetical protein
LPNKALPFIRVLFARIRTTYHSPDYDEFGEPFFSLEYPIWHHGFKLGDHLKFNVVYDLHLFLHAVFIALADHCNDEIHEDDVPDDQNDEPEEPCQDFEVSSAVDDC